MNMELFIFSYFSGLFSLVVKRKHFLCLLLSLEFIIISLYMGLMVLMMVFDNECFFLMVFLTISVCESALGLSVLVSMIRVFGNDYYNTFSILW